MACMYCSVFDLARLELNGNLVDSEGEMDFSSNNNDSLYRLINPRIPVCVLNFVLDLPVAIFVGNRSILRSNTFVLNLHYV